jgi:hypothetical protein
MLRWHRDLIRTRHANISKPIWRGQSPTMHLHSDSASGPRNPPWGYRGIRDDLATLGIKIAASTVREILKAEGLCPAPKRSTTTWANFLPARRGRLHYCPHQLELLYHERPPHQRMSQTAPLRAIPRAVTAPDRIAYWASAVTPCSAASSTNTNLPL